MKKQVKERFKKLKSWILQRWGSIEVKKQNDIIRFIETNLNYLGTSLMISVPLKIFFSFNYFLTVLGTFFLLPVLEHYYIWFREKWKDNLIEP